MTREHKLALLIGFFLVLVVGTLVADHFSEASRAKVNTQLAPSPASEYTQYAAATAVLPSPIPTTAIPTDPIPTSGTADPLYSADVAPGAQQQQVPSHFEIVMGSTPPERPELGGGVMDGLGSAGIAIRNGISQMGLDRTEPALRLDRPIPDRSYAQGVTTPADPLASLLPPSPPSASPQAALRSSTASPTSPPAASQLPTSRGKLLRHEIVSGDNLSKIAARYYGDKDLWRQLQTYNGSRVGDDGMIRQGVTLLIPPKDVLLGQARLAADAQAVSAGPTQPVEEASKPAPVAKPVPAKSDKPTPRTTTYTVKSGDTLAKIAQRQLGSSKRWPEIRELNKNRLEDDDTIHVGLVLALPAK